MLMGPAAIVVDKFFFCRKDSNYKIEFLFNTIPPPPLQAECCSTQSLPDQRIKSEKKMYIWNIWVFVNFQYFLELPVF